MAKSKKQPADHTNTEQNQNQSADSTIIKSSNNANEEHRNANAQDAIDGEQSLDPDESPVSTRPKGMDA